MTRASRVAGVVLALLAMQPVLAAPAPVPPVEASSRRRRVAAFALPAAAEVAEGGVGLEDVTI